MRKWTDATSYSRDAKIRTPRVWETLVDKELVSVHRYIDYGTDTWLVTAYSLGIEKRVLRSKEIGKAQDEALGLILVRLKRIVAALEEGA